MTLFTGKGDDGTTKVFGCNQRISKSSAIAEALGALDEVNSFLGLCKIKSKESGFYVGKEFPSFENIVHSLQEGLFIVQAEVAGAPKFIKEDRVKNIEAIIDAAEKELPPIHSFFISGGVELAVLFDFARTLARRAERRVIKINETGDVKLNTNTLAFMNRLSSILYALARLSNHKSGVSENSPSYK